MPFFIFFHTECRKKAVRNGTKDYGVCQRYECMGYKSVSWFLSQKKRTLEVWRKKANRRKTIWRSVSCKLSVRQLLHKHPRTTFVLRILPIEVQSGLLFNFRPALHHSIQIQKFRGTTAIGRRFSHVQPN